MAWKWRRGKAYYYQSRREGRRVVSDYIGAGLIGQYAAQLDYLDQAQRRTERADRARFRDFDTQARQLDALVAEAIADVLTAAGYHQHKRQWRKRRGG